MADDAEKTEEPTARKLDEARGKGQVALSNEFVTGAMLAAMVGSILVLGGPLASATGSLIADASARASALSMSSLSPQDFAAILSGASTDVAYALALLVTPVILMGFLTSYGQVGFRLTPKAVGFDPNKLNPVKGAKKIFGARGWVRTALGLAKILLIGTVVAIITWHDLPKLTLAAGTDAATTGFVIGGVMLRAVSGGIAVILALSLIDLVYQRFQHSKDMRMSKQEIKDEAKNSDGDPQVKARIRQIQREFATSRMMEDVPKATAVVANPTHFSVALRYEDGRDIAPTVVAKGLDHVALRIREVAEEAGVMVVVEPPLARALHRSCEIGDAVPEELFEAVAKLLAYVYRVQGQTMSERRAAEANV